MPLEKLTITHLRNISQADLTFSPGMNLIAGPNASGKTSLLEAIALLTQGRSFRTPRIDQLIQHKTTGFTVAGQLRSQQRLHTLGINRSDKKTQVRLDGTNLTRMTALIDLQPLHVITPESHEILAQGPKMRRQYLDWGVFHVKQSYLPCWQRYHRVLRQRNHVLRQGGNKQAVQAWDSLLVEEANRLHAYRLAYLAQMTPSLQQLGEQLLGMELEFRYRPGWEESEGAYADQLATTLNKDVERGFTQLGPHRADIAVRVDGMAVKTVLSRGQQKLLICVLYLAQTAHSPKPSILLIDDLPAELDPTHRARLMQVAAQTGAQLFVTATEADLIPSNGWAQKKVFHVEHGEFHEVV